MADIDEDNTNASIDDALEETRHAQTGVGSNPLPEDGDTPASLPTDMPDDDLPIDHPSIDSNIDPDEAYHEGTDAASEAVDKDNPLIDEEQSANEA